MAFAKKEETKGAEAPAAKTETAKTETAAEKKAEAPVEKPVEKKIEKTVDKPTESPKRLKAIDIKREDEPFKIDPETRYEFELIGVQSPYFTIPRKIKVWDADASKIRVIRYSSVEASPFEDEQSEDIPQESDIVFTKGKLYVPGRNASLIKFLLEHDWIEGKKRVNPENTRNISTFRLVNRNIKISASLQFKQLVSKATAVIAGATLEDIKSFMLSVFNFDGKSEGITRVDEAIELEAYRRAESTPEVFIKEFNSDIHAYKALVLTAFKLGLLDDSEDGLILRKDTGTVVYKFDTDKFSSADSAAAAWIQETTDGKKFYSQLKEEIEG